MAYSKISCLWSSSPASSPSISDNSSSPSCGIDFLPLTARRRSSSAYSSSSSSSASMALIAFLPLPLPFFSFGSTILTFFGLPRFFGPATIPLPPSEPPSAWDPPSISLLGGAPPSSSLSRSRGSGRGTKARLDLDLPFFLEEEGSS